MPGLRRILPWLLIVAAPAGMLYPLWSNPLSAGEDDVIFNYPLRKMVGSSLAEGRWPVYNPLEATGMPLMGEPQATTMYPLTLLFALIDPKLAYSLSIFSAFSIAGAGAYLYLRGLGLARPAAAFGAVAFMFCGFMVGHRVHLARLQTAAFVPWGLWCIELLRRRPAAAFLALVPAGFLAITAGDWAILTYMGLLWAVYLLVRGRPVGRSLALAAGAMLLALALAAPQLQATGQLLAQATRKGIGYLEFSENSFLPAAGVLALLPMLMGSRTPNFFPQDWWGPGHLCEMLGYVGLACLVLAGAAVWRLGRWNRDSQFTPLVRLWTCLAAVAGVWSLGYYLPTYRLIHMIPVLNVVRCPARMLLVVDMALASLAAIAIHVAMTAGPAGDALRRTIRRATCLVLPAAMLGCLVLLATAAVVVRRYWPGVMPQFTGTAQDALEAVHPANPAVWVPLALAIVTIVVVRLWLARPQGRAMLLVAVLLADLFFLTRFVDSPAGNVVREDPEVSPAAAWLRAHGPWDEPYRVLGLSGGANDRPAELLLPKTGQSLGFATLGGYGAWHAAAHAHLLGFDHYGGNRQWASLVRRNYLLSLYGVRYLLAADAEFRGVIESVRIADGPAEADGPNLLGGNWRLEQAGWAGGVLRLSTPTWWRASLAAQALRLEGGRVYRISMDVRAPGGQMDALLRAQVCAFWAGWSSRTDACLEVNTEEVAGDWRHFEWTFLGTGAFQDGCTLVVSTGGQKTVEVRNIQLRASQWDRPVNLGGRLQPGQAVYAKVAELPALESCRPAVAVYENLLCLGVPGRGMAPASPEAVEALRNWAGRSPNGAIPRAIDVSMPARLDPAGVAGRWTAPACALYLMAAVALVGSRFRKKPSRA